MQGVTVEEIREGMRQVGVYVGFPRRMWLSEWLRMSSNVPNDKEERARVKPLYSGVLIERQPHVVLCQALSRSARAGDVVQLRKLPAPIEGIFSVETM